MMEEDDAGIGRLKHVLWASGKTIQLRREGEEPQDGFLQRPKAQQKSLAGAPETAELAKS
jgi:hypothetical protein